ncbi:MAG: phosphate ABC transporter substrate-binding protein PstS, partial [Microcystis aeruginosa]
EIKRLLTWILTTGQGINNQLEFTRIPQSVTQKVLAEVNKIK